MSILAAASAIGGCGGESGSVVEPAWVEIGPGGQAIARIVTDAPACPRINVDGRKLPMSLRAGPEPPLFPVLVCEAALPPHARRVSIRGAALPLPRPDPERIALVGDTGCRIRAGDAPQACNDPAAWPFARVARAVAALEPELIVHLGDYLYRESPCPPGNAGCAGSPFGYDWATIDADFFTPAARLLRTAPLVLTRGNHEACSRAGAVWFRFFDPRPLEPQCADYTEPYAISAGDLQLLMLDSAVASDTSVDPMQVAVYRQQFATLRELAGARAFLLTHRPMWVFGHLGEEDGMEVLFRDNPTLQAASDNDLPAGVEAVLSGHIHLFELLSFSFDIPRPPQIVVGNSGTNLDPPITTPLAGLEIAGATVSIGAAIDEFGFVTLDRAGAGWRATLRAVDGTALFDCEIAGGQASCA